MPVNASFPKQAAKARPKAKGGPKKGGIKETPTQAFETLRQALNVVKEKHYDPWNWHKYIGEEPQDPVPDDPDEDPEVRALRPKARKNVERAKAHLLTTIQEMNRAAQAADMAYFHLCTSPEDMRECMIIMGSAGDIDADLLLESGDASPAKILAALQRKLDKAHARIEELQYILDKTNEELCATRLESDDRWMNWQRSAMQAEEAISRLDRTKGSLDDTLDREDQLLAAYRDLHGRFVRASRLMIYKARQGLRDRVFLRNPQENLFYAYHGFMTVLQTEKEERIRQEREAEQNAVMFALKHEVKYLLREKSLFAAAMQRVSGEAAKHRAYRRDLACRLLHKNRPHEVAEYFLWIWELWIPLRPRLVLEKMLETEQAIRAAMAQQLTHTAMQIPELTGVVDDMRREWAEERVRFELDKRQLVLDFATQTEDLLEKLRLHRSEELFTLHRIHRVDVEAKEERIAILEREIAENQHVQALRGMVVDLESRLRKALDRRKQLRGAVISPGTGPICSQCGRENLFRDWKNMAPKFPSLMDVELKPIKTALAPPMFPHSASETDLTHLAGKITPRQALAWSTEKKPTFTAVWR